MTPNPTSPNAEPFFDFRSPKTRSGRNGKSDQVGAIRRDSPLPLYHQLYEILNAKIESGEWQPDTPFPSEKELSEQYDVSRTTVRQTLQQMVVDSLVYRRQGRGTFVARPKLRHGPQRDLGISGYIRAHGLVPGWQLISMNRVLPPKRPALALGLDEPDHVLEITRLRLASGEVIGIHTLYIPLPIAARLNAQQLTTGESSLSYLECAGVTLTESHRLIQTSIASAHEAELLGVEPGSPLLQIQRVTIGADGKPVEYMDAVYRGDRFEYYVYVEHKGD